MIETITLDCLNWPETKQLIEALHHAKVQFKFVGGCVRDALLGHDSTDIDIATSSMPQDIQKHLTAHKIRVIPTGIAHGTVTALVKDRKFEITTLRKDLATDGRHSIVEFTDDWKADASRRDFTMNALYADDKGVITDYFGGVADAKAGHVKFIGDAGKRIEEDALRILRFFRFSARYAKGAPDAEGLKACSTHAAMISNLSGERIQMEMLKLLVADGAPQMLDAMRVHGILEFVIPAPVKTEALPLLHELESHAGETRNALRALALLLRSNGEKTSGVHVFLNGYWKLSGAQHKTLEQLSTPLPAFDMAAGKSAIRKHGKEFFIDQLLLSGAEKTLSPKQLEPLFALAHSWQPPVFPVDGNDLLAKGLKGPALGAALAKLEEMWERSDYTLSRDELLKTL